MIKGMGELHLEILVDRMKREFKVDANVGAPQVAYRETITRWCENRLHPQESRPAVRASSRVSSWSSSRSSPARDLSFENKVTGGSVPKEFVPASKRASLGALIPAFWPASR